MIITATTMALAITHDVLAMPTAVITLSSENTISNSMICVITPAKLVRRFACSSSPSELVAFQGVMDLSRSLVEKEKAARDQNDIPPGDEMAEQLE